MDHPRRPAAADRNLWFDWLCDRDEPFFERWVAMPLALSAIVLGAVACYQLFVDVHFLNPTVYADHGRASGTMLDGNVSGAIAALWIGGWTMVSSRMPSRRRFIGAVVVIVLWLAV